ncbi:MAG: alanine racemase [Planctomycetota bacterium]|nr:alanine racemase [Planctomycetota bacterium]
MPDASTNPFAQRDAAPYALPEALCDELQTPALVVYLDRVRENVQRMIDYVGGVDRWRPHLKTTKIPEVWSELLRAGVRQFKCATTREAAVLLDVAAAAGEHVDLLVAYPHRDPSLRRVGGLAAASTADVSVLVEDVDLVAAVPASLGVFVDLNPGMNRTGVPLDRLDVVAAIARGAGERFRGLHFYDGHLHGPDLEARRAEIFAGYERLLEVVAGLDLQGVRVAEVITAGTPAFHHALQFERFAHVPFVHRVSPGTVVFHDARSELENPDVSLTPAALVASRVISRPADDVVTCDAGSKSVAAEAGDPCAFALGRQGLAALPPSEEHLPLRCTGAPPPRGDMLLLVPRHVCPTVNLAEHAVLIESGRDPRVVPVAARAHEVLASPRCDASNP